MENHQNMAEALPKNERILRMHQITDLTGLSKSTLYLYMKQGKFPRSIPIGERSRGFVESQVQEWINQKIGGSNV
jgi:prophage regulatory protein